MGALRITTAGVARTARSSGATPSFGSGGKQRDRAPWQPSWLSATPATGVAVAGGHRRAACRPRASVARSAIQLVDQAAVRYCPIVVASRIDAQPFGRLAWPSVPRWPPGGLTCCLPDIACWTSAPAAGTFAPWLCRSRWLSLPPLGCAGSDTWQVVVVAVLSHCRRGKSRLCRLARGHSLRGTGQATCPSGRDAQAGRNPRFARDAHRTDGRTLPNSVMGRRHNCPHLSAVAARRHRKADR
jgi:hypothetical protein